jgi:heterotetrameric sarcosine oxidase gamma subunit
MGCRLERLPETPAWEFVAYPTAVRNLRAAAWFTAPGAAEISAEGSPRRLHFAPGRWLLPDPDRDTHGQLDAAVASGFGMSIDVEGKWVAMVLSGPDARRVLASTIDIAAVLANRGCAAVSLFDCPAVAMRDVDRYRLWVAASYAESFEAAVGRLAR